MQQVVFWLSFISLVLPLPIIGMLLACGVGPLRFRQRTSTDDERVTQLAGRHGFGAEVEVLEEIGFRAIGVHETWLTPVDRAIEELAFTHGDLPIVCSLSNRFGVRAIRMVTDDAEGRFVVTMNHDPEQLECDEPDLFIQVADVSRVEQIFEAHMQAVSVWEDDGFEPKMVLGPSQLEEQSQRFLSRPVYVAGLRATFLLLGVVAIPAFVWLVPLPIIWLASLFLEGGPWAFKELGYKAAVYCLSVLIAASLYWHLLVRPVSPLKRQNSKQNRLNTGFENSCPKAVQYRVFELTNQMWSVGLLQWWIALAGMVFAGCLLANWLGADPIEIMFWISIGVFCLSSLTPARRWFPRRCVVMVNDDHVRMQTTTIFGDIPRYLASNGEVLSLADIVDIRIEDIMYGGKRLVFSYHPKKITPWIDGDSRVHSGRCNDYGPSSLSGFEVDEIKKAYVEVRARWQKRLRSMIRRETSDQENATIVPALECPTNANV